MGPGFVIDLWPFCRGFMVGLSWMHGDFVLNLCWALCWVYGCFVMGLWWYNGRSMVVLS